MANYEKPVVISNEDAFEGVYAGSGTDIIGGGDGDCWTVNGYSVQDWNGSEHVFEIHASHHKDVTHITTHVVYNIPFSGAALTGAKTESDWACSFSGNTVTVERDLHANGYYSGDEVTFKVWVTTGDEATTKALNIGSISYTCRHETNVQGGID